MFWYIVLGCLAIWAGNHYVDPMFGYWVAYVVIFVVGVCVVWIHLVKPLFFPTWRSSASVSGHRGNGLNTMTLPDLSTPQRTLWQRYKSASWIAFKCWFVWFVAKGLFALVYAGSGRPFTPQAANVITVAALAAAGAWYFWRYVPRRAGQLADAVEHSEGGRETASRIMEEAEAKYRQEMADTARYLAEHGMASPEWRPWLPADYKQKEIENKQKEIEAEVQARFNRKGWWEWFEPRVGADTSDNPH
jgi:membrane protein implicated in regulation of membrane protease activity